MIPVAGIEAVQTSVRSRPECAVRGFINTKDKIITQTGFDCPYHDERRSNISACHIAAVKSSVGSHPERAVRGFMNRPNLIFTQAGRIARYMPKGPQRSLSLHQND